MQAIEDLSVLLFNGNCVLLFYEVYMASFAGTTSENIVFKNYSGLREALFLIKILMLTHLYVHGDRQVVQISKKRLLSYNSLQTKSH